MDVSPSAQAPRTGRRPIRPRLQQLPRGAADQGARGGLGESGFRADPGDAEGGRLGAGGRAGEDHHVERAVDARDRLLHPPRVDGPGDEDPVGARGAEGRGPLQGGVHSPGAAQERVDPRVDEERHAALVVPGVLDVAADRAVRNAYGRGREGRI